MSHIDQLAYLPLQTLDAVIRDDTEQLREIERELNASQYTGSTSLYTSHRCWRAR
ncbi:hypothetical protein ABC195_00675 [Microbacterium sp. 2P01SA-2]|uniref:hypothetical protein n=1 Tax=unclassified Microbacterium TaxID=2609290 RepID=UPI0039A1D945